MIPDPQAEMLSGDKLTRYLHNVNVARFSNLESQMVEVRTYGRVAAWAGGLGCTLLGGILTAILMKG